MPSLQEAEAGGPAAGTERQGDSSLDAQNDGKRTLNTGFGRYTRRVRVSQQQLDAILPRVSKPARYTGGELNQVVKPDGEVDLRVVLAFPDVYEVGSSNMGL